MTSTLSTGPSSPKPRPRRRNRRTWIMAGACLLIAVLAVWFFFLRGGSDADPYRTEEIRTKEAKEAWCQERARAAP